jgi:hypothetical protein
MTSKQTSALTDRPGGYKGRCLKSRVGQNLRLFGLQLLNQEPDARLENETADSASVRGPKIADLLWERYTPVGGYGWSHFRANWQPFIFTLMNLETLFSARGVLAFTSSQLLGPTIPVLLQHPYRTCDFS